MRRVPVVAVVTGLLIALVAPAAPAGDPYCGIRWGSLAKTADRMSTAPVVDVRAGRHACFDRLVVDLGDRPAPGYRAGRLVPLTAIHTTPGFTDEKIHLFLALELSEGRSAPDRDEFLECVVMPLSGALSRIRDGEIVDAKTICAILFAARYMLGGDGVHQKENTSAK
jgi:hypothetical protein